MSFHFQVLIELALWLAFIFVAAKKFSDYSRGQQEKMMKRWTQNFSTDVLNRLISFLFLAALFAPSQSSIIFENFSSRMDPIRCIGLLLTLDFIFYWRHRLYHRFFWALHRFHHEDDIFDFSLALRVHPLESLLHLFLIYLLTLTSTFSTIEIKSVIEIFAIQALLSHWDFELPRSKFSNFINFIFVLPQYHKQHHAADFYDCNYGFLFSFWDRAFGTVRLPISRPFALGLRTPRRPFLSSLFCSKN